MDKDAWLSVTSRLLRGARLGQQWPDVRRIASHLEAMAPAVHGGLAPPFELDPGSGLPGFVHWQQVVSDQSLAAEALATLEDEATLAARAETRGLPIDHRQLARRRYARALVDRPLAPLVAVDARVRRVDGDEASLLLVLDKLETSGRFVRVTMAATQAGAKGLVQLDADVATATAPLRDLVFRQARLDVELLWVALADQPGLTIERLERGVVGPVWADAAETWPAAWAELGTPGERAALCCTLELAATDLAADHDGDPFAEASAPLWAARSRYGFKVSRERRFVVPAALEAPVRAWCRDQGKPCVVRRG